MSAELLRAVERANRWGGTTADVAEELGTTTRRARARLVAAEKRGEVSSFQPDPIFKDRETYWRLEANPDG
jgi:predicted transcriptional regulator